MSITDELRSYADHEAPHYELSKLHAMADRIDAEHGASIIRINETIRRIVAQGETIRAEVERLKAENAKLRKIAREQLECMAYGNECDGCPHRIPAGGCDAPFWEEYSILMDREEDDG